LYVDNDEALRGLEKSIAKASVVALDTEFIREKTYYPQLCLIQVAARFPNDEKYAIIDPLTISDLTPIKSLFTNENIVKVLHAGDQDLAIFYQILGVLPKPLFDTQRAANLLGYTQQIGLAAMVKAYCDIKLDKTDTFSNWGQRPLTQTQIAYAYDDVRYLPRIYEAMHAALKQKNRLSWLDDEFSRLTDPATYEIDVRGVWRRVRRSSALRPVQLCALRELAAWRELTAQKKDYPRKWVATDELLLEIARRMPQTLDELYMVRNARDKLGKQWAHQALAAVHLAQALPPDEWPLAEHNPSRRGPKTAQIDMLNTLVHLRASENSIAPAILASHDDLVALACGQRSNLEILKGWRKDIIGLELIELLEGKLSLRLDGDNLKVTSGSQHGS
jgi:ribonuclease D